MPISIRQRLQIRKVALQGVLENRSTQDMEVDVIDTIIGRRDLNGPENQEIEENIHQSINVLYEEIESTRRQLKEGQSQRDNIIAAIELREPLSKIAGDEGVSILEVFRIFEEYHDHSVPLRSILRTDERDERREEGAGDLDTEREDRANPHKRRPTLDISGAIELTPREENDSNTFRTKDEE